MKTDALSLWRIIKRLVYILCALFSYVTNKFHCCDAKDVIVQLTMRKQKHITDEGAFVTDYCCFVC